MGTQVNFVCVCVAGCIQSTMPWPCRACVYRDVRIGDRDVRIVSMTLRLVSRGSVCGDYDWAGVCALSALSVTGGAVTAGMGGYCNVHWVCSSMGPMCAFTVYLTGALTGALTRACTVYLTVHRVA